MVVPEFSGKNITSSQFIERCNEAKFMIEPESEINLVQLLGSKISGEARQAISGRTFLTIDELQIFLKNIYSPARTTPQSLGELGHEFQIDHENVITFSNRIRDIGTRILDLHNSDNGGQIDANFRASVENTMIDSFKRELKFELEQRLGNEQIQDVNNLVQCAITIERKLEAERNLRRTVNHKADDINVRTRRMFSCQICKRDGHEIGNCGSKLWCSNCQLCKKKGHTTKGCFLYRTVVRITCQLCSKQGHSADKCFSLNKPVRSVPTKVNKVLICQICNRNGHEAARCRMMSTHKECKYYKTPGHSRGNITKKG